MRSGTILGTMAVLFGMSVGGLHATDTSGTNNSTAFSAGLSGFNEVPLTIFSPGSGSFQLNIDRAGETISYELTYSGMTTSVTQAHIHFGKEYTAGGVMAFLCSNLGNAPAGVPACPAQDGTVSGTITPSQVMALEEQNVSAGDFNALVSVIESEAGYVNVHTTQFPAGEIRGQIQNVNRGDSSGEGGEE